MGHGKPRAQHALARILCRPPRGAGAHLRAIRPAPGDDRGFRAGTQPDPGAAQRRAVAHLRHRLAERRPRDALLVDRQLSGRSRRGGGRARVDIRAGESPLSRLAAQTPLAVFEQLVELGGGRILGDRVLGFWGPRTLDSESVRQLLQVPRRLGGPELRRLEAEFQQWHAATVDLPGTYYLEVVEWLYKQNRLAEARLVALGHRIDLARLRLPLFLLAARDDDVVVPEQVFATARRVGTAATEIETAMAPCQHLGLFMGARTLRTIWPKIARWLAGKRAAPRRFSRSAGPDRGAPPR